MKTLDFTIEINAPKEKVWEVMLQPETYKEWTSAFTEGSYYEGSWEKGSEIKFLTPDGVGMFAEIADSKKYEYVSIKHLGMIREGKKAESIPETYENYILKDKDGKTEVKIEMDNIPGHEESLSKTWSKALNKIKEISER